MRAVDGFARTQSGSLQHESPDLLARLKGQENE